MKLVGFSQGVSLANTKETTSYLEFLKDNGKPFRLEVPKDCLERLLEEISQEDEPEQVPLRPEEAEQGATVFGEEEEDPEPLDLDDGMPQSEAEVPPL